MRALFLFLLPLPAMAACPEQAFVSCPVGGGNVLEVCIGADSFSYTFGTEGAPELALSVPMSAGTVTPWPGVGGAIWSSVAFENAGHTYEVWSSVSRDPENIDIQGGVNVMRGETLLAQRTCLPGTAESPAFMLEDAMAAAGYCWDFDARTWGPGPCG